MRPPKKMHVKRMRPHEEEEKRKGVGLTKKKTRLDSPAKHSSDSSSRFHHAT